MSINVKRVTKKIAFKAINKITKYPNMFIYPYKEDGEYCIAKFNNTVSLIMNVKDGKNKFFLCGNYAKSGKDIESFIKSMK